MFVTFTPFVSGQDAQTLNLQIKVNGKIVNEEDLVSINPGEKIQLNVAVSPNSGHLKDITGSEKTLYQSESPWNLSVQPGGSVEVINYPFDLYKNRFDFFGLVSISYKEENGTASRKVRFYIETVPGKTSASSNLTNEGAKYYFQYFNLFNHDRLKKSNPTNTSAKEVEPSQSNVSSSLDALPQEAKGLLKTMKEEPKNENNMKVLSRDELKKLNPSAISIPTTEDFIEKLKEIPGLNQTAVVPALDNQTESDISPLPNLNNGDQDAVSPDLKTEDDQGGDKTEEEIKNNSNLNNDDSDFIDYEKLLHQPPSNSSVPLQN
jgi:hypothetical protein